MGDILAHNLLMTIPDTKYVLELANEIESVKARLALLQSKWTDLFSSAGQVPEPNRGGRKADPDGPASKVVAALETNPLRVWNANDLAQHLGLTRKQVEKALFNLCDAGKIKRVDRGTYAANAYRLPEENTLEEAAVN